MAGRFVAVAFALILLAFAVNMLAVALQQLAPFVPALVAVLVVVAIGWFIYRRQRY